MVDAKRKPMDKLGIEIGNGSQVNIAFNPTANYVAAQKTIYVTLYLSAVQVIELKEYTPSNSPFEEEDGYIEGLAEGETDEHHQERRDEEGEQGDHQT